jgi:hypothetical protein
VAGLGRVGTELPRSPPCSHAARPMEHSAADLRQGFELLVAVSDRGSVLRAWVGKAGDAFPAIGEYRRTSGWFSKRPTIPEALHEVRVENAGSTERDEAGVDCVGRWIACVRLD